MSFFSLLSFLFISCFSSILAERGWNTLHGGPSKIVGHRGEKAFMPEHSLGSYHQSGLEAIDYIEPDVCLSKDGVLVVIHNEWLGDTTNVANLTQFANRKRQYQFDGKFTQINRTDWWVFDFTLAELKTLNIIQASGYPYRPQYYNTDFTVLTFEEYLDKVESLSKVLDREFGIIPELKSPEVFNTLIPSTNGRGFEDKLLEVLERRGYTVNQPSPIDAPMGTTSLIDWVLNIKPADYKKPNYKLAAIQSFDQETCQYLASQTKIPIVALDENTPTMYTPAGLDKIASYSKIFSPWKDVLFADPQVVFDLSNVTYNKDEIASMGGFLSTKDFVAEAHKRGIELSPYTFYDSRQDNLLLCGSFNDSRITWCPKNRKEELFHVFDLGIDYIFSENHFESQMLRLSYDYELANKN
ncbi:hypothetical protein BB560_007259 [Smittium megazygosporum]|uniref:glycerophosphodiester phosphodiesterase n=1 Tax=Smittium megazygosporum TaxID=133381 RepID=A0A2T9XXK1_9FUNG|nr:hypothetical protein BB560_007259 [Smittium megazygosporum]